MTVRGPLQHAPAARPPGMPKDVHERSDRVIRRQITALSVLAALGWVFAVVALLFDPAYAEIGGGVAGPLFVAGQILLGILVWRLAGRADQGTSSGGSSGSGEGRAD